MQLSRDDEDGLEIRYVNKLRQWNFIVFLSFKEIIGILFDGLFDELIDDMEL